MAFDEARNGGGRRIARGGGASAGSSGFDSIPISNSATSSYQNGDAAFTTARDRVERELTKLTSLIATARKQVDAIGTRTDSSDLRARVDGNISKGKDAIKTTGSLIKTEFEPFVRATDISRAEAEQRRVQLNRFTKEYKSGVDAFTDVANAAVAAMKRHPVPSAATTAAAADGGPDKADGRKGGKQEDSQKFLQQLQQVDLTESLLQEREAAIDDITTSMVEVNEAFKDLSQIVEGQGELLNQIEVNVVAAHDSTEKGVGFLEQAAKYQKKYRKWLLFFLAFIILTASGICIYFFAVKK